MIKISDMNPSMYIHTYNRHQIPYDTRYNTTPDWFFYLVVGVGGRCRAEPSTTIKQGSGTRPDMQPIVNVYNFSLFIKGTVSNRGPEPGLTCSLVNVFKFSSFMKGTVSKVSPEPGLTCSL